MYSFLVDLDRVKQSCLDTAFYCQDLKTKLTHDLKKSLHSTSNYENIKSNKLYYKHLNETISLVADRVLDSRQELRGYFKNQIMKLQRDQRIMEETEAANKLKEKLIAEENGMSTKEEVERYLKANKLFGADKEDPGIASEPQNPSSPRPPIPSTPNTKLTPKPPTAPLMPNTALSPRAGNLVSMTAVAKRKIRGTQSTAMNLDEICDELLQVCQLDGKRCRLESLKKMLQGHVMYQLCLLTLVQSDLLKLNQQHQAVPQTDVPPPPPYPPSLQQEISGQSDRSTVPSEGNQHGAGVPPTVPQNLAPKTKKVGIRHVYLKDNLRMCDEDDSEDENIPKKMQFISTGLSYAQSVFILFRNYNLF